MITFSIILPALIFILAAILSIILPIYLNYISHIDMVKRSCYTYKWGSYQEFYELFFSHPWYYQEDWPNSLFGAINVQTASHESEIHANIFKFDNKGFCFKNTFHYIHGCLLVRKAIKIYKAGKPVGTQISSWEGYINYVLRLQM